MSEKSIEGQGATNLGVLRGLATQISGDQKIGNKDDWLVQQDKEEGVYAIKRHGVLRNTLVRIAVGFGKIFGL